MKHPELLQVGDLLFYEADNPISWTIAYLSDPFDPFGVMISHVSGVSQIDADGTIHIIEAHARTTNDEGKIVSGVVEKKLNPKWYPIVHPRRYVHELLDTQKGQLIRFMRENIVGHPYDLGSFPSKFIRQFILSKEKPIANSTTAYDCAEALAVAYKFGLDILLTPNINEHTVNPRKMFRSKFLIATE